jgi:mannose-1-phosphate guanylyltransferase
VLQALILAGGEGTRLRPLTSTIPKPVVPLVDRPFITYMIEWLRSHGVDDVILACGFMADDVRSVIGDGSSLGLRLRYIEEPRPLGTGGALKYAADLLADRFLMLNGDVLTDIDLGAQLSQHERTGARATLALVKVEDPAAYGLVRCGSDQSVQAFVEKPAPGQVDTNLISAGAYVLERDVLDEMAPAGTNISIERDVFPLLVSHGLYGYVAAGYWLDIGTPERYLQGSFDILSGRVRTQLSTRLESEGSVLVDSSGVEATVIAPALVQADCVLCTDATIGPDVVLGPGVFVGERARVRRSVLLEGASIGTGTVISDAIVGPGAHVGDECQIGAGVVVGKGAVIGPGNVLEPGARIFPDVVLGEEAITP